MKTLYLDLFSGISGDMFLGAMLDLGVDLHALEHELEKLGLEEFRLHASRQQRGSVAGRSSTCASNTTATMQPIHMKSTGMAMTTTMAITSPVMPTNMRTDGISLRSRS